MNICLMFVNEVDSNDRSKKQHQLYKQIDNFMGSKNLFLLLKLQKVYSMDNWYYWGPIISFLKMVCL